MVCSVDWVVWELGAEDTAAAGHPLGDGGGDGVDLGDRGPQIGEVIRR